MVSGAFNAQHEAAKFTRFLQHGPAGNPTYQIPEHVLAFAKTILEHASPYSFFRSLRIPYGASAAMSA